jgi:hypothetical protein
VRLHRNLADDLSPGSPSGPPVRMADRYAAGDFGLDEPEVDPFSLALPEIRGRGGMAKGPSRRSIP